MLIFTMGDGVSEWSVKDLLVWACRHPGEITTTTPSEGSTTTEIRTTTTVPFTTAGSRVIQLKPCSRAAKFSPIFCPKLYFALELNLGLNEFWSHSTCQSHIDTMLKHNSPNVCDRLNIDKCEQSFTFPRHSSSHYDSLESMTILQYT